VVGFHLLEELLDTLHVFLRKVEGEVQIGKAAELEALDELVANEAAGVFEGLNGVGLLFGVLGSDADENAGMFHVGLHADLADTDVALEAWILEFAGKHGVDFVGDFFANAFVSVMVGHGGDPVDLPNSKFQLPSLAPGQLLGDRLEPSLHSR
jgi:hypothetical protein